MQTVVAEMFGLAAPIFAFSHCRDVVVEASKAGGMGVFGSLIGSLEHALAQKQAGVDLIVSQGTEAGGHTGTISTMVLTPQVVDLVAPLPVLAAGGIASGRQMAAALALGAQGVWCGSVWLGTVESETHPAVKKRIFASGSQDAVITKSMTGKTLRAVRSAWTDAWAAPDAPAPLPMPLQSIMVSEALTRIAKSGNEALASYPAGQVIGQMKSETSVRQVFNDMLMEYADTAERLGSIAG